MKSILILFLGLLMCHCVTGNDVDINVDANVTVSIDMCQLIDDIQHEPPYKNPDSDLQPEWGACQYNEDCTTDLCVCDTCIDMARFIKFGN